MITRSALTAPGAIGYAAYELRQGIEYLLFHLLVISSETLSEEEYQDCFGPAKNVTTNAKRPCREV